MYLIFIIIDFILELCILNNISYFLQYVFIIDYKYQYSSKTFIDFIKNKDDTAKYLSKIFKYYSL